MDMWKQAFEVTDIDPIIFEDPNLSPVLQIVSFELNLTMESVTSNACFYIPLKIHIKIIVKYSK